MILYKYKYIFVYVFGGPALQIMKLIECPSFKVPTILISSQDRLLSFMHSSPDCMYAPCNKEQRCLFEECFVDFLVL